ncbi:MAG TPA: hypothetical protein DHW02_19585, partial [Ktedonobacter sp.]|nr:hypothetical protein [Ktedonobacter sp.]
RLTRVKTVYTQFNTALSRITTAETGNVQDFVNQLQERLDTKLEMGSSPDTGMLLEALGSDEES